MLDRSRASRAFRAAIAVVCLLSLPTAAARGAEAPPTRPVPADAPTVATTPSGDTAIAWVVGGRTCVVLQLAGAPRPTTLYDGRVEPARAGVDFYERTNGSCVTTPVLSQFRAEYVWALTRGEARQVLLGVAGPGAARVEARRAGAVQGSSPAAVAPLPGPAGALRFWALERPGEDQQADAADELAVLDASGTVRRAYSPDDFGTWGPYAVDGLETDPKAGTFLRSGRAGATRWQLRRTLVRKLVPTPLEAERRVDVRCLALTVKTAGGGTTSRGPCDDGEIRQTPLAADQDSGCGVGTTFTVLARPPVRAVVAVLADGTRARIGLSPLGGGQDIRGGAVVVAPGMGVRRLEGLGAGDRVARTREVGVAPLQRDCSSSTSFWTEGLFEDDEALGRAPHVPHAVDSGAELCLAIDRAPKVPSECAVPPLEPEAAWVSATDAPGGGEYAYGLVPVEVSAARVTFTDGTTQIVPATPIPGYAGQYATTIAQIALDVPAPRAVRSTVVLDAAGRVVGPTRRVGPSSFEIGKPTTLLPAAAGLPALRATPASITFGPETVHPTCVGFTILHAITDPCELSLDRSQVGAGTIAVSARCEPRRMVVFAALRRAADRLVVETRAGREVVARSIRIPASAGDAAGRYVAFAVLGPHDPITGMKIRGRGARTLRVAYPATAAQCGYDDQPGAAFS